MGTAIAKIGSAVCRRVATSQNTGRIVYSTVGNKGTLFDALIDTYKKPNIGKQFARQVHKAAKNFIGSVDEVLKPICDDFGVYGSRAKKVPKIAGKVAKEAKKLTLYDAIAYISTGNFRNIIGDANGARIIMNNPKDYKKFMQELIKAHKNPNVNFQIACVENYHGKGISPYIDDLTMGELQTLSYKDNLGRLQNTIVSGKIKKAGYTRTNIDAFINGTRIEFQVGGPYTTRFGEVEHYLYDMRQTGAVDLSHLNESQKCLFFKMKTAYQSIINNPIKNAQFEEYTTKIWQTLKIAEEKGLKTLPQLPKPPEGIPKILSGKNIMLLEEVKV